MTVRVAVIGCGVMGADHARVIANETPNAVLQLVCDPDKARMQDVADACGALHGLTDAAAVAGRADVDAVLIASPDATHADLALDAIHHRKPSLVEKPLAPSPSDILPLLSRENDLGHRLISVGFMRRYDPSYRAMRRAVSEERIGAPLMFHSVHRNVAVPEWFDGPMAITNSASHDLDIARFLLGVEIAQVSALATRTQAQHSTCPPVMLTLVSEAGQIVTIEVHVAAQYGYDVRGELVGTTGTVELTEPRHMVTNSALNRYGAYAPDWRPRFAEAYRLQNAAWVAGVIAGQPDPVAASAWDGYVCGKIAETAVAALRSGTCHPVALMDAPSIYNAK